MEVSTGGVKAASERNPPSFGRGIFFDGNSFLVGSPDKHLKNLPAVRIGMQGHLRVPLDSPDEGLAGEVHRLDEIVLTAGHLHEVRRQGLDRLVMATVDTQLRLFQQSGQWRQRPHMHRVGRPVVWRLHGMPDL